MVLDRVALLCVGIDRFDPDDPERPEPLIYLARFGLVDTVLGLAAARAARHRARRLKLENQAALGVAAGCADTPALGSEQLLLISCAGSGSAVALRAGRTYALAEQRKGRAKLALHNPESDRRFALRGFALDLRRLTAA